MMFERAPRLLLLGMVGGLSIAVAACGSSTNPPGDTSMFGGGGDDASPGATGEGGTAPGDDSGPAISVIPMDAAAGDDSSVTVTADACAGDACDDTTTTVICGDGIIEPGELCDDGNASAGDGCSDTCQLEPGYTCVTPGQPCVALTFCGNGVLDGLETCDDGNVVSGDGCSASCQVETGWQCPVPNSSCTTLCGDGIVVGREQCDLGPLNGAVVTAAGDAGATEAGAGDAGTTEGGASDGAAGDARAAEGGSGYGGGDAGGAREGGPGQVITNSGCSSTCTVESGFACAAPPAASACHATVCGDGIKEGYEQCDDGNQVPYDGCSPTCTLEPKCNGSGGCTGVCGDGLVFPGEECDDGNTLPGDGCSSTCTVETGYTCSGTVQAPSATLVIPILYRDMRYWNTTNGHPDFNRYSGDAKGLVQRTLGADGEPVWASNGSPQVLTNPSSFCWWYHETGCDDSDAGVLDAAVAGADAGSTTNPYAALVSKDALGNPTTLTLAQGTSGTYTYANPQFFPVDGLGWNAGANPQTDTDCEPNRPNGPHNFSFTSELHYLFTFDAAVAASSAPAVFSFTGDDSVWAFINNQLVVDLGGVHSPEGATYTLDTAHAATLGLVDRGWYSIDVFQAEQHVCRSTYNLTLGNFTHVISACQSTCGDGVVAGREQCDTGATNVPASTAYGKGVCTTSCMVAPSCGDAVVEPQFGEACDDGTNLATYGGSRATACGPGCQYAPYCGDGIVNGPEPCDNGANNVAGPTAYGAGVCTTACTAAPRCGDGIVQAQFGEQCDGTANCNSLCKMSGAM
jgi:fibro-slime domain-containing protein